MHPAKRLLAWMNGVDFAVLTHGFLPHGRDYRFLIEECLSADSGTHELVFTHCVRLDYLTRVRDDVWPCSWSDEFTDYEKWKAAGEPDGYLWGTEWSNAYPGLSIVDDSPIARDWSNRVGRNFYEVTLETDRFFMRIVLHDLRCRKIGSETNTIRQIIRPL